MLGISFQARRIDVRTRKAAAGALHLYLAFHRPHRRDGSFSSAPFRFIPSYGNGNTANAGEIIARRR
jgi:hypothetical protein